MCNVSSSSVNGDIAFLWEWSKFDPPHKIQTPQPIMIKLCTVDYVHYKLVTQIWYKSAVRERLAIYVKYKASLFYFYLYFFSTPRLLKWPSADFDVQWLKLRGTTQRCAFLGSARRPTTYLQNWVIYSDETLTHSWHYKILNEDSLKWCHYNSKMADVRHLEFCKK